MVLRDGLGVVADSLNYGGLVDPWASEGDQTKSGAELSGCYAPAPGSVFDPWSTIVAPVAVNVSSGRSPDGADTDSNCVDFQKQAAAYLAATSATGATNIKVASTEGFRTGQTIHIDSGANLETAVISTVGTAGATALRASAGAGATVLSTTNATGFSRGQTITIGEGANSETAVVAVARGRGAPTITVTAPLTREHPAGAPISGSGISLTSPLARAHTNGAQVSDNVPTPGAPNQYPRRNH
jgi:hypothetical protein